MMNSPVEPYKEKHSEKILPCRGCTKNCPNIRKCDRKPWRAFRAEVVDNNFAGNRSVSSPV
jgi:hypothetical protein